MGRIYFFTNFLLLFINVSIRAQTGCASTNPTLGNPEIYTTKIGTVTPARYSPFGNRITMNAVQQAQPQCNNFYKSIISSGSLGTCRINISSATSTTTLSYNNGWLVNYTLNCPLDDHIWILILLLVCLAFHNICKCGSLGLEF